MRPGGNSKEKEKMLFQKKEEIRLRLLDCGLAKNYYYFFKSGTGKEQFKDSLHILFKPPWNVYRN